MLVVTQKPLHKVISEHKDVLKVVITLNNIIGSNKSECQEVKYRFYIDCKDKNMYKFELEWNILLNVF